MMDREPINIRKSKPVMEGAGVHLKRAVGFSRPEESDPFLLLDDFRNTDPAKYQAGFPWHPHRGIETITYMLRGKMEHRDSIGNKGIIGAGDVQWMTAGSGIIHQEMPISNEDPIMEGFQLWANLPQKHKMTKPRYQEIGANAIPEKKLADGSVIRIICGAWDKVKGPVDNIMTEPDYLDVLLAPGADLYFPVPSGKNAMAYVFGGRGRFGEGIEVENEHLVFFSDGDQVRFRAVDKNEPFRFLFMSGLRLDEPVAWQGPIVMNTRDELAQAFIELQQGNFIKDR